MCKIIVFTNSSKLKQKTDSRKIAAILSASQRDGFGYAIQGKKGVFGERTIKPLAFTSRFGMPKNDLPWVQSTHETFGEISEHAGAAIFHGRTSTNEVSLTNTHPISKHGWNLIHNGVVNNTGEKYPMQSTNDSEHVLHFLNRGGVNDVAKNLTGYYAVAAISPDNRLHVFKDATARLFSGYSKKLDSFIFGTTLDILEELCEDLKLGDITFEPVLDNISLVFEGNNLISHETFKSRGYGEREAQYAGASLGMKLPNATPAAHSYLDSARSELQSVTSTFNRSLDEKIFDFWDELDAADASYSFADANGNYLSHESFDALTDAEKCYCTITRGDGTLLEYPDDGVSDVTTA